MLLVERSIYLCVRTKEYLLIRDRCTDVGIGDVRTCAGVCVVCRALQEIWEQTTRISTIEWATHILMIELTTYIEILE